MIKGSTDAETCSLNGWAVGTRLVGDEGYGPTVIEITAIGERILLAKVNGSVIGSLWEQPFTLTCRDWSEVR